MMPAPAQGAIAIVCRANDEPAYQACRKINHERTEIRVSVERDFLYHLEGGCSVPISALATIHDKKILFQGLVSSLDGKREMKTEKTVLVQDWKKIGLDAANEIRNSIEGKIILDEFRKLNRERAE
jgi:hydroxymethylbilane synthase